MTERELFIQSIPQIAEMIVECRKLSEDEFQQWKSEVVREARDGAKSFIKKVIMVIEDNL